MLCFFPHPPLPMDRFFRFVQPIASSKRITNPKLSRSNLSRFIWNICLFHNDLMHPLCIRASDHSFLLRRVLFHSSQLRFTNNFNGKTMEVLPSWQTIYSHWDRPLPFSSAITIVWRYNFCVFPGLVVFIGW